MYNNFFVKVFLFFVAIFATILVGNAQIFVGGSLGFSAASGKIETTNSSAVDLPSTSTFLFSPFAGYQLSDELAAGVKFGIDSRIQKRQVTIGSGSETEEEKTSTLLWNFGVFGRYNVVQLNKFSVLVEGTLGIHGGSIGKVTGPNPIDGNSAFGFSFGVVPGLSYALGDRLSLEAWFSMFRLGFTTTTVTQKHNTGASATETKTSSKRFHIEINEAWSPWELLTTFQVGFVYKL